MTPAATRKARREGRTPTISKGRKENPTSKTKYIIVHGPDQGHPVTIEGPTNTATLYRVRHENGEQITVPLHWLKPAHRASAGAVEPLHPATRQKAC